MGSKKQAIITILISVVCSVVISVVIILLMSGNAGALSIDDFSVSELKITEENATYSDSTYYNGEAEIGCQDKSGTYMVIYSIKLVSGGTYENIGKSNYRECIVHNGKGTITTYDYGDKNTIVEPNYEIELLGYRSFY